MWLTSPEQLKYAVKKADDGVYPSNTTLQSQGKGKLFSKAVEQIFVGFDAFSWTAIAV